MANIDAQDMTWALRNHFKYTRDHHGGREGSGGALRAKGRGGALRELTGDATAWGAAAATVGGGGGLLVAAGSWVMLVVAAGGWVVVLLVLAPAVRSIALPARLLLNCSPQNEGQYTGD